MPAPSENPSWLTWLGQQWFLIALLAILSGGQFAADYLNWLPQVPGLRPTLVVYVMFIMALGVPLESIRHHLGKPWPTFLASGINMGLLPLMAWAVSMTLPAPLGGGLIISAAIPCTLASAAVWTRRAGGEDTIAMLVMLLTNVTCFITTPLWLAWLLGQTVPLDITKLMWELWWYVLVPSACAQGLRLYRPGVAAWANRHKKPLSLFAQFGLLGMILLGAIQMAQTQASLGPSRDAWTETFQTIIAAGGLHTVALVIGWWLSKLCGFSRAECIGVAISGSQKTLMVGLQLCIDCGVSILPMVLYHACQLIIDTLIADWWRKGRSSLREPT